MNAFLAGAAIETALNPGRFFVASPGALRIEHVPTELVAWEIFRGHLLAPAHAREQVEFETWNVYVDGSNSGGARADVPLISIKFAAERGTIFITRQILTHAFEAYEDPAAPGVILSRPVEKWVAELVGTIDPARVAGKDADDLVDELGAYVLQSVIGTSRLPITSLESPLPAFSLGELAYLPGLVAADRPWTDPLAFRRAAENGNLPLLERAKALETALRAIPDAKLPSLVGELRRAPPPAELFRAVFNGAALSPYTSFADRLVAVVLELSAKDAWGAAEAIDMAGYMLRHLCRHLTAFDLTLFHNFGANYPDALFLDELLRAYVRLIEDHRELFASLAADAPADVRQKRQRRRALRQGAIARQQYEGHRVPDAPTSMGENSRVLPAPFVRVPEEQILDRGQRRRTLFAGQPLESLFGEASREVLAQSVADLEEPDELRELGMAHFLDRPLGAGKQPGEIDKTPLLSYEAFSSAVVKRRLSQLKADRWITAEQRQRHVADLAKLAIAGVPAAAIATVERPGVVSVADAQKVAADFVLLRTTRGSLADLLDEYDWEPLAQVSPATADWLVSSAPIVLVSETPTDAPGSPRLRLYDDRGAVRLELGFGARAGRMVGYVERRGVELVERLEVLGGGEPVWIGLRGSSPLGDE